MKAGRMTNAEKAVERADFGSDVPEADEEYQDDEYLVGVGLAEVILHPIAYITATGHLT